MRRGNPDGTIKTSTVARLIATEWGLSRATVTRHEAGMNSRTWIVINDVGAWIAKAVSADAQMSFAAGLAVASRVEAAGIPAGAAIPTRDGRPYVVVDGSTLALLRFVKGSGLRGRDPAEQHIIGTTLGRAHRAIADVRISGAARFHWLDVAATHLDVEPWVRHAIADAIEAYESLRPASLTWGLLHTDPAPEAFLFDGDAGVCGLIDWDMGMVGPLMYDVASAAMYVGGAESAGRLIDAYLDQRMLDRSEAERALGPMLRLRWAVQADYFARRITAHDFTGIRGPEENEKGLDDARLALGR